MKLGKWISSAWNRVCYWLEILDRAVSTDPLEDQQRWLAALEARVTRLEAEVPTLRGKSQGTPVKT